MPDRAISPLRFQLACETVGNASIAASFRRPPVRSPKAP